ncbi:MAG: DUF5724 domain-containing protein [Saprospiraceae bacterium]
MKKRPWLREFAISVLGDRSQSVSATALGLVQSLEMTPENVDRFVDLLKRKSKGLRQNLIITLCELKDDAVLKYAIDQLASAKTKPQQLAALELMAEVHEAGRLEEYVLAKAEGYRDRSKLNSDEELLLKRLPSPDSASILEQAETEELTLASGLGIIDFSELTPALVPSRKFEHYEPVAKSGLLSKLKQTFSGNKGTGDAGFLLNNLVDKDKLVKGLRALHELFVKHGKHEYTVHFANGHTHTTLIEKNVQVINHADYIGASNTKSRMEGLPLAEVWINWLDTFKFNDYELFHLCFSPANHIHFSEVKPLVALSKRYTPNLEAAKLDRDKYGRSLYPYQAILAIAFNDQADFEIIVPYSLDIYEDAYSCTTPATWKAFEVRQQGRSFGGSMGMPYQNLAHYLPQLSLNSIFQLGIENVDVHLLRMWRKDIQVTRRQISSTLEVEIRVDKIVSAPAPLLTYYLFTHGYLTESDVLFCLIVDTAHVQQLEIAPQHLKQQSKLHIDLEKPKALLQRLAAPIVEIELARGDLPTDVSPLVGKIKNYVGADLLVKAGERLRSVGLKRGYSYYAQTSMKDTLSHVVQHSVPADTDTVASFAVLAKAANLPQKRWIELAVYAPQWADFIGVFLNIPELRSGVWWFHAHATDYNSSAKETVVARYTETPLQELKRGGVDVDWFAEAYAEIGRKDWKILQEAAKYISDGNGHRQVKLYSSVLLGEIKIKETYAKVNEKRDQVYVRALGIVPLSKRNPEGDLLKRYERFQAFVKESKQFGNQRQTSEREAVDTGIANLARTAGYADVTQFEWRMEGQAVAAMLADSAVELEDLRIGIYINALGKAEFEIQRGEKSLKSIPVKLRKHKLIERLTTRRRKLRDQLKRTRTSLERAMVAGTMFTADDVVRMEQHPIVAILLEQLLFFVPELNVCGRLVAGSLIQAEGESLQLSPKQNLQIAHPSHLYRSVSWDQWQRVAFAQEWRQPFKQIFRELYLLTEDERETRLHSERYQGHQVQPQKAVALLRTKGWTVSHEEGLQRVDRKRNVLATLFAQADWFSPAEVEAPILEQVSFHDLKTHQQVPLEEVDPILFSEVMRDVDLVVSVAHSGGVDPQASHSTMEMRAALVRESARLFKLDNVEVKERHVIVKGSIDEYAIHLGSGMVSRRKVQLPIIAVQSQQRGRVFLPFVDDDPKSAEVVSKVLLLSRDEKIQDPTILAWLSTKG